MSNIFFMAVQCCQCSTMQAKQMKTNSKDNKWKCVVCNQKQSIRKVFAQSPMAKHLRHFVQSFNMSRQSQTHRPSTPPGSPGGSKRPRSDWTEFLDPREEISATAEPGGEFDPEIVTEMPVGFFKKAKLSNNAGARSETAGDGGGELCKPVFCERKVSKQVRLQEPRNQDFAKAIMCGSKERHQLMREAGEEKSRTNQLREGREASKWSNFITRDDDDDVAPVVGGSGKFAGQGDDWSIDMLESLVNEEKVQDEEIHPDFL